MSISGTWKRALAPALGLAAALLLAGCQTAPEWHGEGREESNPAPTSSMTKAEAVQLANLWVLTDRENRSCSLVAPTGSMLPFLDSHSVLLLEKVKPQDLRENNIAIYQGKTSQVVHRVKEITPDGIWFEGDNNHYSDGWIKPEQIRWRIAGILYCKP